MIEELILQNYNANLSTTPLKRIAVKFNDGGESKYYNFISTRDIRPVRDEKLYKLCVQEFGKNMTFPYYTFKYQMFAGLPRRAEASNSGQSKIVVYLIYIEDGQKFDKGSFLGLVYRHDETGDCRLIFKPNKKRDWVYTDGYKSPFSFTFQAKNILTEEVLLRA